MQGTYFGGYPWKDGGILTAEDLNAAVALALSPVSVIPPGSIDNAYLKTPWVQIGTTRINLGATVTTLDGVLDPVNDLQIANKHYVDQHAGSGSGGGGIPDAPADANTYGRHSAAWAQVVPIAGGVTVTGTLGVNGMFSANSGLTVIGGSTVNGGMIVMPATGPTWQARTGSVGLPPTTGATAALSTIGRFMDTSGACLDVGSNGVSGLWLDATNTTDHTQRYPLLLQPRGGDTRMGGNATVTGTLQLNGGGNAVLNVPSGGITVAGVSTFPQGVILGAPLGIASGGTGTNALAQAPTIAPVGAWAATLLGTSGSAVRTTQQTNGYLAINANGILYSVAATDVALMTMRMRGTFAAPAAVQSGDLIGGMYCNGYDGSAFTTGNPAAIQMLAGSNWTPTNRQTAMNFFTTALNFTNPTATMTLDGTGNVTITGAFATTGVRYTGVPAGETGHSVAFGWNGAALVAHVDGTTAPGSLAAQGSAVSFTGITVGAGGINNSGAYAQSGTNQNQFNGSIVAPNMSLTGSGTALSVAGGQISASAMVLTGGGNTVLNVNNGGIAVAGASTFPSLTLNGGGAAVLNVPSGGITVAGISTFPGLTLTGSSAINAANGGASFGGANGLTVSYSCSIGQQLQVSGATHLVSSVQMDNGLTVNGGISCAQAVINGNAFPASDNAYQLGISGNAWYAVTAYGYANASDARLKTDIEALPDCLDLVDMIHPARYRWREGPDTERVHWGFIAQDVEAAMSAAGHDFGGHTVEADRHMLSTHELVAVLWKATQELAARLAKLEKAA